MHNDIATLLRERNDRVTNLVGETPELGVVLSFVSDVIDAFDTFRGKEGNHESASNLRWKMNKRICQLVGGIAGADCIFIRQLQTDQSVRLVKGEQGESLVIWNGSDAQDCAPPEEKGADEGVSGQIINAEGADPVVIANVHTDPRYSAAHTKSLTKHSPESTEGRFVHRIKSEVCIPLRINDRVLAGIVAVSWRYYSEDETRQIANALQRWQAIFAALYFAGLQLERQEQLQQALVRMTDATRSVGESISAISFLERFATVLTCDAGLRWHRAMVFLFEDSYPSSARCVVGLGGDGQPAWFEKQTTVQGWSLSKYLSKTDCADFAQDDALYRLVSTETIAISESEFKSNKRLHKFLMGEDSGDNINALFSLASDALWLRQLPWFSKVFPERPSPVTCYLAQLLEPATRMPFGFVVLDNPYRHSVETEHNQFLTYLICDQLGAYFAARGIAGRKAAIWGSTAVR